MLRKSAMTLVTVVLIGGGALAGAGAALAAPADTTTPGATTNDYPAYAEPMGPQPGPGQAGPEQPPQSGG